MKENFFKTKKIFLLSLVLPVIIYMTGPSSCGGYKRPVECESISEFMNAMFIDVQLQNLPILISFVFSLLLIC